MNTNAAAPTSGQRLSLRERPGQPVVMRQDWEELLFLHWKYDPAEVQRLLPPGLMVDTFAAAAWIGIVPFFMRNVRPIWSPAVPWLSHFLELNIRTYVHDASGNPGVWFFSLDASNPLAVAIARIAFKLPYFLARMSARVTTDNVDYSSQRKNLVADHFIWNSAPSERLAEPGSLDFFLVERYLLYSRNPGTGRLYTGRVHHEPYRLRDVTVSSWGTNLLAPAGLGDRVNVTPDHQTSVASVRVDIFGLK